MDGWTNWSDQRPPNPTEWKGLYWWRVGHVANAGCTPEFIGEFCSVGMGYSESEYWPEFSDWDGYRRTVPAGTQWKPLSDADRERVSERVKLRKTSWICHEEVIFPGVDLRPCPFCGRLPKIDFSGRWATACVNNAESFRISPCCGMVSELRFRTVPDLAKAWNTRA